MQLCACGRAAAKDFVHNASAYIVPPVEEPRRDNARSGLVGCEIPGREL